MSRPVAAAPRPDAAVDVMIGCLATCPPVTCPLVVDEATGRLAAALAAMGARPVEWLRMATPSGRVPALPWPAAAAADAAFVRMPKSKEALDMALHAAAAIVPPGGPVLLFGANDEGIRSAATRLEQIADDVATLEARKHCRVLAGKRKHLLPGLRGTLAAWRRTGEVAIAGVRRPWIAYPGVFAGGALDAGTALLLAHLPELANGVRVLDYAAGTGVVAAAVLTRQPSAEVDMIEADAVAVEAARANVPGAAAIVGTGLEAARDHVYHVILSNPPVHEGVSESRAVLDRLVAEAPRHLAPGGRLRLVVQRRIPVMDALRAAFGEAEVIADDGRFTVAGAVLASRRR